MMVLMGKVCPACEFQNVLGRATCAQCHFKFYRTPQPQSQSQSQSQQSQPKKKRKVRWYFKLRGGTGAMGPVGPMTKKEMKNYLRRTWGSGKHKRIPQGTEFWPAE